MYALYFGFLYNFNSFLIVMGDCRKSCGIRHNPASTNVKLQAYSAQFNLKLSNACASF